MWIHKSPNPLATERQLITCTCIASERSMSSLWMHQREAHHTWRAHTGLQNPQEHGSAATRKNRRGQKKRFQSLNIAKTYKLLEAKPPGPPPGDWVSLWGFATSYLNVESHRKFLYLSLCSQMANCFSMPWAHMWGKDSDPGLSQRPVHPSLQRAEYSLEGQN